MVILMQYPSENVRCDEFSDKVEKLGYVLIRNSDKEKLAELVETWRPGLIAIYHYEFQQVYTEICQTIRHQDFGCFVPLTALVRIKTAANTLSAIAGGANGVLQMQSPPSLLSNRISALVEKSPKLKTQIRPLLRSTLKINALGIAVSIDDCEIEMTSSEFKVLAKLARTPNSLVPRVELLAIHGINPGSVATHLTALRKKLAHTQFQIESIHNGGTGIVFPDYCSLKLVI